VTTSSMNPVLDFGIDKSTLQYIGHDLQRPECILAEPGRHAVVRRRPRRRHADCSRWAASGWSPSGAPSIFEGAHSEAIRYFWKARCPRSGFRAQWRHPHLQFRHRLPGDQTRDGESRVLADSIDGEPIGKSQLRVARFEDRIWTPSRRGSKLDARRWRTDLADGYWRATSTAKSALWRMVPLHQRIRFDACEEWDVRSRNHGRLQSPSALDGAAIPWSADFRASRLGQGRWPDGIAFDSYGNLWGTLVYSESCSCSRRRATSALSRRSDPEKVDALSTPSFKGQVNHDVLFATGRGVAPGGGDGKRSTFGGPDLQNGLHHSLRGPRIPLLPRARPDCRWSTGNQRVAQSAGTSYCCDGRFCWRFSPMRQLGL